VACAADDVPRRQAEPGGRSAHQLDAFRVEGLVREPEELRQLQFDAAPVRYGLGVARELGGEALHLGRVRVAELDAEANLAGHDVPAVRLHLEEANRAAPIFAAGSHHPVHEVDDAGRADQGVAPRRGRRGAGVAVLAQGARVPPDLRLGAGDDADGLAFAF